MAHKSGLTVILLLHTKFSPNGGELRLKRQNTLVFARVFCRFVVLFKTDTTCLVLRQFDFLTRFDPIT
jgi:hypothetical protein